jgi:hypothetical protein
MYKQCSFTFEGATDKAAEAMAEELAEACILSYY